MQDDRSVRVADPALTERASRFLVYEVSLLDAWELERWVDLFDDDSRYEIPSTDAPTAAANESQYFVSDDVERLRARVKRLLSKNAHAENPRSRLLHIVTNVAAWPLDEDLVRIDANVILQRVRDGHNDGYFGRYRHIVREKAEGDFVFKRRRVEIVQETLSPGGRLSFIF
jgi:p-cumate 2,3-dioxygenase beta subunit